MKSRKSTLALVSLSLLSLTAQAADSVSLSSYEPWRYNGSARDQGFETTKPVANLNLDLITRTPLKLKSYPAEISIANFIDGQNLHSGETYHYKSLASIQHKPICMLSFGHVAGFNLGRAVKQSLINLPGKAQNTVASFGNFGAGLVVVGDQLVSGAVDPKDPRFDPIPEASFKSLEPKLLGDLSLKSLTGSMPVYQKTEYSHTYQGRTFPMRYTYYSNATFKWESTLPSIGKVVSTVTINCQVASESNWVHGESAIPLSPAQIAQKFSVAMQGTMAISPIPAGTKVKPTIDKQVRSVVPVSGTNARGKTAFEGETPANVAGAT